MTNRKWFYWSSFSLNIWYSMPFKMNGRRMPLIYFHRLANAGRLQFFWLSFMWPLPWHKCVKNLPGYGIEL